MYDGDEYEEEEEDEDEEEKDEEETGTSAVLVLEEGMVGPRTGDGGKAREVVEPGVPTT